MRFRRRSRRHQYSPEQNLNPPVEAVSPAIRLFSRRFIYPNFDFARIGTHGANPFYCYGNINNNPLQINAHDSSLLRTHVPKCLGIGVSYSDILRGDRPDNFSPDCWLQDCLHRFGFVQRENNDDDEINQETEEVEEDDDSPVGSETSSQSNSSLITVSGFLEMENGETINGLIDIDQRVVDISSYTQVLEPPPYNDPNEPPPTYEEAVGLAERRSNRSSVSGSSDIAFLW